MEETVRDVINFADRASAACQAAGLNNKQSRRPVGKTLEDTIVKDVEFDNEDDEDFDDDRDKAPELVESDEYEPDEKVQVTPTGRGVWVRKQTKFFDPSHSSE